MKSRETNLLSEILIYFCLCVRVVKILSVLASNAKSSENIPRLSTFKDNDA